MKFTALYIALLASVIPFSVFAGPVLISPAKDTIGQPILAYSEMDTIKRYCKLLSASVNYSNLQHNSGVQDRHSFHYYVVHAFNCACI